MKVCDSGMPDKEMWDNFFDPTKILTTLGIGTGTGDVVEFGCGYGTFTIPAAELISGTVFVLDISQCLCRSKSIGEILIVTECGSSCGGLKKNLPLKLPLESW